MNGISKGVTPALSGKVMDGKKVPEGELEL
jgi:hypothetical protein